MDAHVLASFPEPVERLAIAERNSRLKTHAPLDLRKIQYSVDQGGPAARHHMPGLRVKGCPDGGLRSFGDGHFCGGNCAATVMRLDVMVSVMIGHLVSPCGEFVSVKKM
jgi:hypothetical protein